MHLLRIVRMDFSPEKVSGFMEVFNASKQKIRAFPGCLYLALHTDLHHENVKYTYSLWESEEALNLYRHSELFKTTWAATKVLFQSKAQAFSLIQEQVIAPASE